MKIFLNNISGRIAAMTVGIAFITSVIIVTVVDDFILANFVVPGNTTALAKDIETNSRLLYLAAVGYLLVLALDSIIAVALFVVLEPANKTFATLTAALRLMYACALVVGVILLVFEIIDVYGYAFIKRFGYVFFALHILVLGFTVFRSGYIPKSLGLLLMLASIMYIVFFVEIELPEIMLVAIMLTMALAELLLSIWLIVKRKKLPDSSYIESTYGDVRV